MLLALWQSFVQSKCRDPRDVACICIDGPQPTPGWLLARCIAQHAAACVANRRGKAVVWTRAVDVASIVRLRRPVSTSIIATRPFLLDPTTERGIMRLHVNVSRLWIGRHAAPIGPAIPWKDNRAARGHALFVKEEGCKRPCVIEAAGFLVNLHAGFRVLGRGVFGGDDVFFLKADSREWRG